MPPTYIQTYNDQKIFEEFGKADLVLFTGNSTINSRGELVMGRGFARQMRDRFPGLAKALGDGLRTLPDPTRYGVFIANYPSHPYGTSIGVFQVKSKWWAFADPDLIAYSVACLSERWSNYWSLTRVAMNMPGVGNGGLRREEVVPLLESLPLRVVIYELLPDVGERT